jgi:nonsense-mediated mRNA decay protein 3
MKKGYYHVIKYSAFFRYKTSEQLISKDIHTSVSNYKFTYSAEIVPVCKDDLVCIPKKLSSSFGNINQLLVCTRISNSIHLLDVNTLAVCDVSTTQYYRYPFTPLASAKAMIEYYVLDVEPLGPVNGKRVLCDVHIARMSDFGRNDEQFIARSHLGAILSPGDTVMGYDLTRANYNNDNYDLLNQTSMPDVVLVRKAYPARRKKTRQRNWKLHQLGKEVDEMLPRKQEQAKIENDMELFMRDIEEDPEFRSTINIFKDETKVAAAPVDNDEMTDNDGSDEEFPEISLEEMMDEMALNMDGPDDVDQEDEDMMQM